jgi:glycosyltransferase involved in cell wall biosynthesis
VDIWPELIESGASSIVEGTSTAFADEIQRLVEDPELRASMSAKGKPYVMRVFDEQSLIQRYEKLYAGE